MSIHIPPTGSTSARTAPAAARRPTRAEPVARAGDSVKLDTLPPSPPIEVHEAIGVASQAYDRLASDGRALSFKLDSATGKLTIEVRDRDGQMLFTVPGSKALEVASGASLD